MELNSEAISATLKMAGQNTAELDKTLRIIKMVQTIQNEGVTPETMMGLLAQSNPKAAAMATLMKAMNASTMGKSEAPPGGNDIQYNHF